jgi:hypothetical protein
MLCDRDDFSGQFNDASNFSSGGNLFWQMQLRHSARYL